MSDNKVRLIDANALMQRICGKECGQHFKECHLEGDDTRCVFRDYVQSEPTVEAEPVVHGHWIRGENKSAFPAKPSVIWYCSCCGEMIRYNDSTGTYQKKKKKVNEINPRCRRCGARMGEDIK